MSGGNNRSYILNKHAAKTCCMIVLVCMSFCYHQVFKINLLSHGLIPQKVLGPKVFQVSKNFTKAN